MSRVPYDWGFDMWATMYQRHPWRTLLRRLLHL